MFADLSFEKVICEEALALDAIIEEASGICCLHSANSFEVMDYIVFGVEVCGDGCGAGCFGNKRYLKALGTLSCLRYSESLQAIVWPVNYAFTPIKYVKERVFFYIGSTPINSGNIGDIEKIKTMVHC